LVRKANKHQREKKITVLKASKWNKIESTLIKIEISETPNSQRSSNKRHIQTQKKEKKKDFKHSCKKYPKKKESVFLCFWQSKAANN
jgi:hypothetical protein